jgi:hypothetical protein
MYRMVDKLIHQYGTDLILCRNGEETAARGFFRAVTSRDRQSTEPAASPLGELARGQYTYIGPSGLPISEGDTVTVEGQAYRFRRAEPYYYGNRIVYYRGLCIEKGGAL